MNEFIPVAEPYILEEDAKAVYECVRSGWISMGKRVKEFEDAFSEYVGAQHAIAMNNGTSTLHAALNAMGVGEGDEVIVPTLTYISSANSVLFLGAKPVLCECDPKTFNAEPLHMEQLITEKTKVLMPVDMNGLSLNYDRWTEFAAKYNLPILADSAEAAGTKYMDKLVGSQVKAHSFSFFPNKNLTTGEGGMVTTNDDAIAENLRIFRNQGQDYRYHHIELGHNYRMTDIHAALGNVQLARLEWAMKRKREIAAFYYELLKDVPGVRLPYIPDYATRPSWYMFAISLDDKIDRDRFAGRLKEMGIETRCSFPPIHIQPYYVKRFGYKPEDYPVSYKAWKQLLNIPVGLGLTEDQLGRIVEAIKVSL